jgi:hypothetical protein
MSGRELDALIVRHLIDLEDACERLTNELDKEIFIEIDHVIREWARSEDRKWFFKETTEDTFAWMAPEEWRTPDADAEQKFRCRFKLDTTDNAPGTEFYLTSICDLRGGPFGICWACDHDGINMKTWKKFLQPEIPAIENLGFRYQEKSGTFFVPIIISQNGLAEAIEGDNIEDALAPVLDALKIIEQGWKSLDGLFRRALEIRK